MGKLFKIPKSDKKGNVKWITKYITEIDEARKLKRQGYSFIETSRVLHDDFGYTKQVKEALEKTYYTRR